MCRYLCLIQVVLFIVLFSSSVGAFSGVETTTIADAEIVSIDPVQTSLRVKWKNEDKEETLTLSVERGLRTVLNGLQPGNRMKLEMQRDTNGAALKKLWAVNTISQTRLVSVRENQTSLHVRWKQEGKDKEESLTVSVKPDLRETLKGFQSGDHVTLEVKHDSEDSEGVTSLHDLWVVKKKVESSEWLLLKIAVIYLLVSLLFGRWFRLIVGEDNRLSNSKFQIFIWFLALVTSYTATVYARVCNGGLTFMGGVSIPPNLLLLSGLSVLTYGAAKGITQTHESKVKAKTMAVKPSLSNLFCDDSGNPDIGDFQMIIITMLAVGVYILQIYDFLEMSNSARW